MEKKINAKIAIWVSAFKKDIAGKILASDQDAKSDEDSDITSLLQYIYNYPHFNITKQDLQKRTRIKNTVPYHDRCRALRANQEQCTRRKRNGSKFCGTHIKGIPHGEITDVPGTVETFKKVQVWAQEISGIIRHLDKNGNVYDPQDIYQGINNPKVIAKYTEAEGVYHIQ